MPTLAFLNSIGPMEFVLLLVLGILIFGKKLPDIGRNVGKSIVEFKKGLAGVDDEANAAAQRAGNVPPQQPQYQQPPQQYQQVPPQQYQQNQLPPQQNQQFAGQPQQPTVQVNQPNQQPPADQNNRQA